jgi:AcrR family transcriptional regulator
MERYPSEMSHVNAGKANGNRRQQQAQATRDEICRVAQRLFLESGYVATTIDVIANEAGVAVQTIYNSVGNKAAILNAILERVVTDSNGTVTVSQFMSERVAAAEDLLAAVQVLADWMVEFNGRAAAVFVVLRQAAAVDPEVDALQRMRSRRRLQNYGHAAAQFRERGGISAGTTDAEVAASIWALGHPDVYTALVVEAHWTIDAYAHWVSGALREVLIP